MSVFLSLILYAHCNFLDNKWANVKGRFVYKDNWKELDDLEIKKNWTGCLLI